MSYGIEFGPKQEFPIERGTPIPPIRRKRGTKYPWHELKVGDSFFVRGKTIQSGWYDMAKRFGIKVKARNVAGGVRVWRVW